MHRHVLAAAIAVLLAAVPQPARAAARSTHRGGCGYDTVQRDTTSVPQGETGTYTGVLYAAMPVYSEVPGDNPVSAILTCTVRVSGVPYATARFAGTGVVAGVKRISFPASGYDYLELCMTIDYTSDDTPDESFCAVATETQIPPQELLDVIDQVIGAVDSVLCPIIAALAPGVPGVVDVSPEGNVTLPGGVHWTCYGRTVIVSDIPVLPVPPECSDGVDNDLDGLVDYPADTDCWGAAADAEGLSVPPGA